MFGAYLLLCLLLKVNRLLCGFSPGWVWNRWSFASNILHAFYGVMLRYWNLHLHLLLPFFPWHSPQPHRHMTVLYTPALGKLSNIKHFNIQRLLRTWKKIRYSTTEGISQITFIRVVDKDITWTHCYECLYYCNVWRLVKPTTSYDKCHDTINSVMCALLLKTVIDHVRL